MGPSLRSGTALGLAYGALAGLCVCFLEWPFPNYTLLGNEVLVSGIRRVLGSDLARAVDTPLHLFLIYALAGAAGGFAVGLATGVLSRVSSREPDGRARFRLHSALLLAGLLTAYGTIGVAHFRLPAGTTRLIGALILVASLVAAYAFSWIVSRFVPRGPVPGGGLILASLVVLIAVGGGVSVLAAKNGRARDLVDVPLPGRNGSKVVVFCLDGTGWDILAPLRRAGRLPNISRIVESGSWGRLRSTMPPIKSPQVWTSIATSRLPEDHQVYDFLSYSPASGQWVPTTNRIRRVRTFWDVTTELGVSSDILSWYPSWPPDSIPGVMLTDRATLGMMPERVYPAEREPMLDSLLAALEPRLGELRQRFTPYDPAADGPGDDDLARAELRRSGIAILDQTFVRDEVTLQFAKDCLRRGQPELMTVYFRGTDSMQHKFRKFYGAVHDPWIAARLYDVTDQEREQLGGIIDSYFEYIDECIGEIVDLLEPETTILFVSDHGHSYRNDNQINLRQNPLMVRLGWTHLLDDAIDFGRSRLYARIDPSIPHLLRIYVNLEGREETGIVPPDELRSELEDAKATLVALETLGGLPLFESVEEGSDVGRVGSTGDLRCLLNRDALGGTVPVRGSEMPVSELAYQTPKSGNHRITGIFAVAGKNAAKGKRIRGASVYDVIPTLFHLLDLPLSREWEGDPIAAAVDETYRKSTPVRWVRSYESAEATTAREASGMEGADEAVLEELRALGYIQ